MGDQLDAPVQVDRSAFAYLDLADHPALIEIQDRLKAVLPADAAIEWQLPKTLHITLAFCMEATDAQIRAAAVPVQATPIPLRGARLGMFENGDERALHIEIEPSDDLKALQAAVYEGFAALRAPLSEFSAPDAYQPHITLAYLPAGIDVPEMEVALDVLANKVCYGRDDYKPYVEITLPSAIKAGRVLSGVNADAIRVALESLIAVLRRAGVEVGAFDQTEDDAEAVEAVLKGLSAEQLTALATGIDPNDHVLALGGAVKALASGEVGGYLVEFGDPGVSDLQRERFVADTDFALDWYQERPLLFHHGLDGSIGTVKIGTIKALRRDDKGLWLQAILDERNEYVEYVRKLVDMGVLGLSAGSLPHLVKVQGDGTIKAFPIVEGSLTHMPADPRTRVMSLKSFLADPANVPLEPKGQGLEAATGVMPPEAAVSVPEPPPAPPEQPLTEEPPVEEKRHTMDVSKLIALIESILSVTLTEEQKQALNQGLAADLTAMQGMTPDQMKAAIETTVGKAFQLMQNKQETEDAFTAAIKARVGSGQPQSRVTGVTQQGRVTDVQDLRFAHLSAQDMVFGANLLHAAYKSGIGGGIGVDFLRATYEKVEGAMNHANDGHPDVYAVKAALRREAAIKADEVFASNLTNNGSYFVGVAYDTQLWEAVRQATIYREWLSMGMLEVEVPKGYNSIYIPTEGTDPTFYSLAELNDETSDERLPVTGKSSNVTATRRQLTPGFIGARVSFTDIMDEDSLIPVLPFLRQKMEVRGQEVIENLMINGDTETSTTNINYDGSAVSGLADAKGRNRFWTAFDGFLKFALVTASGQSRSGGGFDESDFLETLKLLPSAQRVAKDRLAFIFDPDTHLAALNIAALKTRDVFNPATIENGMLERIYRVRCMESGQMATADTDGKITYNGNSAEKGRLLLIRPDQWAVGRKREMKTEVSRDIDAQATVVVSTMRFGMTYRASTGCAAVTYNLTI